MSTVSTSPVFTSPISTSKWSRILSGVLASAMLCLSVPVAAQEYPSRPIRMIIPTAAGNSTDLLIRELVNQMRARTGWNVVPDNRTGSDYSPGVLAATNAPADGYTIVFGFLSLVIVPHMRKSLAWKLSDLAPVARIATSPTMIAVNAETPASTLAELLAYSKANPGKLNFGGTSLGSTSHLSAEMIRFSTGMDFLFVPYKNTTTVLTDLVGGRLQVAYASTSEVVEHIRSGKLKPVMVLGPKRNALLPNVPTAVEVTGNPELDIASWFGFFVRAGTPQPIIARLEREIIAAAQAKEVLDYMVKTSQEPLSPMEGAEVFRKRLESDSQRWGRVIKQANIPIE